MEPALRQFIRKPARPGSRAALCRHTRAGYRETNMIDARRNVEKAKLGIWFSCREKEEPYVSFAMRTPRSFRSGACRAVFYGGQKKKMSVAEEAGTT
jgi:hypothetical protein